MYIIVIVKIIIQVFFFFCFLKFVVVILYKMYLYINISFLFYSCVSYNFRKKIFVFCFINTFLLFIRPQSSCFERTGQTEIVAVIKTCWTALVQCILIIARHEGPQSVVDQ